MGNKVKLVYFYNGKGGGVFTVITNLLRYADAGRYQNYLIHTICKEEQTNYEPIAIAGVQHQVVFYYSRYWNFYTTCKRLFNLLPDEQAIVVANDWLELGMASFMGIKNRVVQILHGHYEYYYQLAFRHRHVVDEFITVAGLMKQQLGQLLPERCNQIHYLRFPLPAITSVAGIAKKPLSIAFVGRCTAAKGYHLLPKIDALLHSSGIAAEWHIIGNHSNSSSIEWRNPSLIKNYGHVHALQVPNLLRPLNIFILPSLAEGMPVALIEAMQCGLVPVVNCLPGGITELVRDGETGYLIQDNSVNEFAEKISLLFSNKEFTDAMRDKALTKSREMFEPRCNMARFEAIYNNLSNMPPKSSQKVKTFGSRLDESWIPNAFTTSWRKFAGRKK
jgi:glycosyltransferase involved in cell wall biosynthesis